MNAPHAPGSGDTRRKRPGVRRISLALLIAGFLVAASGLPHVKLETDITRFLPSGHQRTHLQLSRLLSDTDLGRQLVLLITHPGIPRDEAMTFSDELTRRLAALPGFASVSNGIETPVSPEQLFGIYFPRRYLLAASDPGELANRLTPAHLFDAAKQLKEKLYSSLGAGLKHIAPRDPLLLFPARMNEIRGMAERIRPAVYKGRYISRNPEGFLVLVKTAAAPFDIPAQRQIRRTLYDVFSDMNASAGGSYRLTDTGVARFAMDAQRLIRTDINRAFVLSGAGMILVFILFFRRIRYMAYIFMPVILGVFFATGLSARLFGPIHGLTLAFGATLIGICIDYPVHLLNHARYRPDAASGGHTAWLYKSLFMSFLTTAVGFAVLFFSAFPGIRQMAFFALAGITYAFVFAVTFPPGRRSGTRSAPTETPPGLARFDGRLDAVRRNRKPILILGLLLPVTALVIFPKIRVFTDVRSLNSTDPATIQADEMIRRNLPQNNFPLVVMVTGDSEEAVLQKNDELYLRLRDLQSRGVLSSFFSFHPMLFSRRLQEANRRVFLEHADFADQMRSALRRCGFNANLFRDFIPREALETVTPLRRSQLAGTSLAPLLSGFMLRRDDRWIAVNLLQPGDDAAFETVAADLPDTSDRFLIRQTELLNAVITSSQKEMLGLFGMGSAVIVLLLIAYERRAIPGLAAVAPAAGSVLVTPVILWLLDGSLNVMHVVSLLLILCMGVDYGIFMTDTLRACRSGRDIIPSVLSVIVSMLTTTFAFGVLVTAGNPALKSIGLTVALGLPLSAAFAFLLVPAILTGGRHRHE